MGETIGFGFGPFCDCLSFHLFWLALSMACVLYLRSLIFPRYFHFLNQLYFLHTREFLNKEVGYLIPLGKRWNFAKKVVPRLRYLEIFCVNFFNVM